MRIGIVSFSDTESGMDLANNLIEAGHEVVFYLPYKRARYLVGEAVKQYDQVEKFYQANLLSRKCRIRICRFPRIRDLRSIESVFQLRDRIKADQLDVVHIMIGPMEIWISILVSIIKFIPVVVTIVIPKPNVGEAMPSWLELNINRLATWGAQYVVVNGENLVQDVQQIYRLSADRVVHIPLAPRFSIFNYQQKIVEKEGHTVLFIGRLLPHKGIEYLIQAEPLVTKVIPSVKFLIAVHSEQKEYLNQIINLIDNNPRFELHAGFMSGEMMAEYYARSTLVVLPYISASTSGVLLDSYSFGKPVIASNIGALPEYIKDGETGILVSPMNVEDLARAIVSILSDPIAQNQMSINAKKWIADLKNEITIKNVAIYNQAIIRYNKRNY